MECGAPKRRLIQRPAEKLRRSRIPFWIADVSPPPMARSRSALPRVCRKLLPLVACSFLTKVFSRQERKGRKETIGSTPRFPEDRILLLYESVFSAINKLFN